MSRRSLDTRPGAITLALDDLVEMAWDGRIRVPHFQRDFKWTAQDVIRLFDSIVKRYPIGSLLLWRRPAEAQRIVIGALEIDAPGFDEALWVVDGQQRITSLVNVLRPEAQLDPRFALGYDLRGDGQTVALPAIEDPFIVPMNVIFDLSRVLRWFADHPEAADMQGKAFDLAKHLRETSVPAYQVVEDDVSVLQDIFDRMNNYGKRLSRAEIFSALNADSGEDDRLSIDSIATRIDERFSFGRIDPDTVLRAILARRGPDIQREIRREFDATDRRGVREFRDESRDSAFAEGEAALARAVAFVTSNGIPHMTVLPYRYLLIVLTRVLAHHPAPDPTNTQLLGRWLWRAAVLGPEIFKGSATGAARALCGRVDPNDLSGTLQGLLSALDRVEPEIPRLDRFRTNTAAAKIAICSWWDLKPRDPGGRPYVDETGEPQIDFPAYTSSELAEALVDQGSAVDAVRFVFPSRRVPENMRLAAANRVLAPTLREPTNYLAGPLSDRLADDTSVSDIVLNSLAFPREVRPHLEHDEVAALLEARQTVLVEILRAFLLRKCEWKFEDTPPLSEFEIDDLEGESDDVA